MQQIYMQIWKINYSAHMQYMQNCSQNLNLIRALGRYFQSLVALTPCHGRDARHCMAEAMLGSVWFESVDG